MEWTAVSREESLKIISAAIKCRLSNEGLRISIISECLRSVLYQYSVSDIKDTREAVASLRLTNAVRRKLAPLWPDVLDCSNVIYPGALALLESMAELGDMIRLEGGKWLTAPLHAVRVDNEMAILLGGDPAYALPIDMDVKTIGRVRLVEQRACNGIVELWDANEWIGAPLGGHEIWMSNLFLQTCSRLKDAPNNIGDVTVYVKGRWIKLSEISYCEKIILLCRLSISTSFSYFLGDFVDGKLSRMSSLTSSDDARRLRFYQDIQENCSLKIKIKKDNGLIRMKLVRPLPRKESKVLMLGWRESGHKYEPSWIAHYVFPEEVLPIVRCAFEGLGILLINDFK